ncbi:MAG: BTAD domain-containing putative transcriptional regulator [Caldilineaceae bacterium]
MQIYPFRFLGPGVLVDQNGQVVALRSRKQLALLVYLTSEYQCVHSRETLLSLLWPEEPRPSAQNNLRFTLSLLRALGEKSASGGSHPAELLLADRHTIQLHPAWVMSADVNHLRQLLAQTRQHNHGSRSQCATCQAALAQAVQLYQGEFLAGFSLDDCPVFEEWLFIQREQLHVLVSEAYSDLAAYAEATGDLSGARRYIQRQIELDPLREPAYRQQMRILARQGERSAALAVFERCRRLLNEELGLDPEPETLTLHMQILNAEAAPALTALALPPPNAASFAQTQTTAAPTSYNLPQQLTPFIGREEELAQLQQRLAHPTYRLLTLIGPGGIGKTRLAIQVASANQHLFPDGVFFVALAGVQTVAAIPAAIMGAMNASLNMGAASSTQQLLQLLAPKKLLLVIDNFEHLLDGVDLLLAILQAAPAVTLLVTTREQLNCQAEDSFVLNGLATPTQMSLAEAGHYAAVRLFCECAYRLHKNFRLTAENCPAVVKICQLVAGMPLALELATTWLGELDCAGLAAAIAKNQAILATTQRDRPARHRSMQAVFDYSWQMLSGREQQLLGQLALCQGRFSAQIATQLTGASLIDLTRLRYKSLLRIAEAGYYDLHPLIRAFALATLAPATQLPAEERLATLYLQQVAAQASTLDGATPQMALQVIEREQDNVQQAWHWAATQERIDLLLQSADALSEYYAASGRNAECEASFLPLVQRLLAQPAADESCALLCLHLLDKLCHALILQTKLADAQHWAQKLIAFAQRYSNREFEARGIQQWGCALDADGKKVAARQKLEDALRLTRQVEQPRLLGSILLDLGITYLGDSNSHVATYLQEALTIQRSLGNRTAEQRILLYLGINCTQMEDYQAGRTYQLAALNLLSVTGNRPLEMRIVGGLGYTLAMLGDYGAALEYLMSARRISQEIQWRLQESYTLHNLCCLQRKLGNFDLAVEYGKESLRVALQQASEDAANWARFHLGYALLARGDLAQAWQTFQQAQASWQAAGRLKQASWAIAGMAAALFQQGKATEATTLIAPIVSSLLEQVPQGEEVYEMYLACYEIMLASGDAQSKPLLGVAYRQLQKNASKLTDERLLYCFWQAPAHRKIRLLWQQLL